jgi:hypothetical protein
VSPSSPAVDLRASQRLIIPEAFSPLPSVHDVETDDEDDQLDILEAWSAVDQLAASALVAGSGALADGSGGQPSPATTTTGHTGALAAGSDNQPSTTTDDADWPLDTSASRQIPDFTQLPGPDFASLGDYMQYMCASMSAQSEVILRLEDTGRRQNALILRLADNLEKLSGPPPLPEGWVLAGPLDVPVQPSALPDLTHHSHAETPRRIG